MRTGRTAALSLLTVIVMVFRVPAVRADEAAVKELQPLYDAAAAAFKGQDMGTLAKALQPDFKYSTLLGVEQSGAQWQEMYKTFLSTLKPATVEANIKSATITGDEAKVVYQLKFDGEMTTQDGAKHPFTGNDFMRDTLVKVDGKWRVKSEQRLYEEHRMDNRPVPIPRTDDTNAARDAIQAYYDGVAEVYNNKNLEAIEKGVPADFAGVAQDGTKLDKKAFLDRIKAGLALTTNPRLTITIYTLSLSGDNAVVVRRQKLTSEVTLPNGMKAKMTHFGMYRDNWTKMMKGWGSKNSEELYAETLIDGKPLMP
jgi:hypothetical protein